MKFVALFICCLAVLAVSVSGAPLRFLAMGDWGGQTNAPYVTTGELSAASAMAAKTKEVGSTFILAIGDNFYSYGVKTVDDPRFNATFEQVFTDPAFQQPFYVVAGNHDHRGNVSAQIAYQAKDPRWKFPNFYYTFSEKIESTGETVQFLMLDTIRLTDHGDADQYNWIEATLKQSKADWIIAAGHYPIYSVAEHGPTAVMIQYIKPLFEKYGVAGYFCGHDHNLQYISTNSSSVGYFVTGAAHGLDNSQAHLKDIPSDSLRFYYPESGDEGESGFVSVSIEKELTVDYVNSLGKTMFTAVRQNPRKTVQAPQ